MARTSLIAEKLITDLQRDFGLTKEQAAGVAGNLAHESAGFQTLQEVGVGGRGGFGYAQWTGPRRRKFEAYARDNKLDPESYEANYGFMKHELETDPYERKQFMKVKSAKTAEEAALSISKNYLRPGTPRNDSRLAWTNQFSDLGSNSAVGAINAASPQEPVGGLGALAYQERETTPMVAPIPAPSYDKYFARANKEVQSERAQFRDNPLEVGARTSKPAPIAPTPASAEAKVLARTFGQLGDQAPFPSRTPPPVSPIPASAEAKVLARTFGQLNEQTPFPSRTVAQQAPIPAPPISQVSRNGQNFNRDNADLIAQIEAMPTPVRTSAIAPTPAAPIQRQAPSTIAPIPQTRPVTPTGDQYQTGSGFRGGVTPDRLPASSPNVDFDAMAAERANAAMEADKARADLGAFPNFSQIQAMQAPVMESPEPPQIVPFPNARIQRKGALDFGGTQLPGVLGLVQRIDNAAANASGTFGNNYDNLLQQAFTGNRNQRKEGEPAKYVRTSKGIEEVGSKQGKRGRTVSQNTWFNRVTGV